MTLFVDLLIARLVRRRRLRRQQGAESSCARSATTTRSAAATPASPTPRAATSAARPCGACPTGFDCQPLAGTDGKVVRPASPTTSRASATLGPEPVGGMPRLGGARTVAVAPPAISPASPSRARHARRRPRQHDRRHRRSPVLRLHRRHAPQRICVELSVRTADRHQQHLHAMETSGRAVRARRRRPHGSVELRSEATRATWSTTPTAAALLGKPVFMTMGNHECSTSFNTQDCGYAGAATTTQDVRRSWTR